MLRIREEASGISKSHWLNIINEPKLVFNLQKTKQLLYSAKILVLCQLGEEMTKKMALLVLAFVLLPMASFAQLNMNTQFGKNQVLWEKTTWNFYQSAHFDFYVSLDIKNEDIQKHFTDLAAHLEGSYEYLNFKLNHGLKKRPIVIVSRTHSVFESLHPIDGGFMPEGVGAYAFPRSSSILPDSDMVLVVKPDFFPFLNRAIYTHELAHIFQFDMIGWSFIGRTVSNPIEGWLYEATADYLANKYAPYSRDDIRKMDQRVAAANVKNPQMGLPTLEMLSQGQANPYSLGAMPFMFLEDRYGEQIVMEMISNIFKQRGRKFNELLMDVSKGEFSSPEAFDRAHRDYWSVKHAKDSLERPQPYQETSSIKGRQIIKQPYPYRLTSPQVSPDKNSVAFLTQSPKNGVVLAVARMLPRDDPPYVSQTKQKKQNILGDLVSVRDPSSVHVLTTFMPPKHYEYIIGQELNVWPFNGSDLDWWQDLDWIAKVNDASWDLDVLKQELLRIKTIPQNNRDDNYTERVAIFEKNIRFLEKKLAKLKQVPNVNKIVFFARKNRDHALFVLDVNTGNFLQETELSIDQAFSPNFGSDGKIVYFSAARNIQRDLYFLNLETRELKNLTNGGVFNSAPRVSPDGLNIVFVAFVGGYQKLFIMNIETGYREQLTFGRWNDNSPSWSSDGNTIVYTSDEKDEIWNLYTFDFVTHVKKQWTEYYGGVFAPKFVPGENDRVVYSAYLEEDQFHSYIYSNFELFDGRLKEPLRSVVIENKNENMELTLLSQEVVSEQLDQGQLANPSKPPARWRFEGSDVNIGASTYWGAFGYTRFIVQDILANRIHQGLYAQRGSFKYVDYTYLDRQQRWSWATNVKHIQYPRYYFLYSFKGEYPRYPYPNGEQNQFTINNTWVKETSAALYTEYPLSKWSRLEFGVQPRRRTYFMPFSDADIDNFGDQFPEIDRQFYNFFKNSNGQVNIGFTATFVHDTVLYSNDTGPLHGDALRAQVEYGPGLNKNSAVYLTAQFDARKYMRLSNSSLFAVRAMGLNSTRPNGDHIILGGSDTLRNYPYFSVAGNQVGYGSAELRFPIPATYVLGTPVRGVLFSDYAITKFSNDLFPARREWSYGVGLQAHVFLPMNFEWARTKFAPDKWNFNFRVGFNF